MPVDELSLDLVGILSLHKCLHRSSKCAAVVDNATPYFAGFPGAVIAAVVFEAEVKRHGYTEYANGLPGQGDLDPPKCIADHIRTRDDEGIKKSEKKGLFGPVEGHPKAVVTFDVHGWFRNASVTPTECFGKAIVLKQDDLI